MGNSGWYTQSEGGTAGRQLWLLTTRWSPRTAAAAEEEALQRRSTTEKIYEWTETPEDRDEEVLCLWRSGEGTLWEVLEMTKGGFFK